MVQLSNSAEIILQPGEIATFDKILINSGSCTCINTVSPSIKMTSKNTYVIHFSGNVTGATAATPVQLAFNIGGTVVPATTIISTPTAAGDFNNIAKTFYYNNCCCDCDRVSVVNSGTSPVTIGANAVFSVAER